MKFEWLQPTALYGKRYRTKTETENTNNTKGNNIQTGVKFVKNLSCTLL